MALFGTSSHMNFFIRFLILPLTLFYKFCLRASSLSPNARMARISSLENSSAYLQIL